MRRFPQGHADAALAVGFALLIQLELWLSADRAADRRLLAPIGLAIAATLLQRRRAPLLALAAAMALNGVANAVETSGTDDPILVVMALLVLVYSVGAHTAGRAAWAGGVLVLAAIVLALVQDPDSADLGGFLFYALVVGGPWLAGRALRIRREREQSLVAERDERARAAVAEERVRIARELHDVVSHAMGVVVLQARGARRVLEREPAAARRALDEIEATSSQALHEMRRLLGLLRADDEAAALAPAPSASQLPGLAERFRDAGLPVELEVAGQPRELPPGIDLSVYRIVQEALTNALRHAGPARAHVILRYGPDAVDIEVLDDGAGPANGAGAVDGGHGLIGMRERVGVLGGRLDTGPRPEGGFAVRARLPL